uniref:Peptidase S1 domain-containing protein n=1 Tax=Acrobeloides nanus TaxID=290746 RepID=A0A914EJD8_9BILA
MRYDPNCRAPVTDTMPIDIDDYLCATSMNPLDYGAPRTCHGDSGAGIEQRDAYQRATLMGITSFGTKGCPANEVARFTKVSSYLKEICEFTGVCYTSSK